MATYEATRYATTGANIPTNTIPATSIVDGTVSNAEFAFINTLSSNAQTQINTKIGAAGGTLTGNLDLNDNVKARWGTDNDLEIYHDDSNAYIKNGSGYLKILEDNVEFKNNADNSTFLAISSSGLTGSGAGLTALNAGNLASGTVPDARFPATLPAASGANLTSLPAANLSGTAAAINGSNITSLNGSNISSGTVADARISSLTSSKLTGALPAIDGSALTGIDPAPSSSSAVGAIREVCIFASSGTIPTTLTIAVDTTITPNTYSSGNSYVSDAPEAKTGNNTAYRGFYNQGSHALQGKTRSSLTGTWKIIVPPTYNIGTTGGQGSYQYVTSSAGLMQRIS